MSGSKSNTAKDVIEEQLTPEPDSELSSAETVTNTELTVKEIFSVIPDLMFVLDADNIIIDYRAGEFDDLYLPPSLFLGKSMCQILPPDTSEKLSRAIDKVSATGELGVVEYLLTVNEAEKWFEARICQSTQRRFIMLVRDITEKKDREERILYQANHDSLTGLYNRAFAFEYLSQKLKEAKRLGGTTAVLYIDIDDFKGINDSLGHEAGDRVLTTVAKTIKKSVREQDVVGRVGGDEFVVAMTGKITSEQLLAIAQKLIKTLDKLAQKVSLEIKTSLSIGIASCLDGQVSASELVKQADLAMYHAKHKGKHTVAAYEKSMEKK